MAEQHKPQDDLSIEEILGSIRRIIAEDEDEPAAEPAVQNDEAVQQVANDIVAEEIDEEPLELTQKIEQDGSIVDLAVSGSEAEIASDIGTVAPQPQPVQDEPKRAEPEFVEKIILVEEPMPMAIQDEEDDTLTTSDALLSSTTAEATTAVMAKLARHTALLEESAFSGGAAGPSIESIVREMLKPMLKSWLDENLPEIVQKMVDREIERLTKRL